MQLHVENSSNRKGKTKFVTSSIEWKKIDLRGRIALFWWVWLRLFTFLELGSFLPLLTFKQLSERLPIGIISSYNGTCLWVVRFILADILTCNPSAIAADMIFYATITKIQSLFPMLFVVECFKYNNISSRPFLNFYTTDNIISIWILFTYGFLPTNHSASCSQI